MSHPIDVGSVLGGRYKVTATVLSSHDQDLVLDGVDQVLNRPVSILVAGPYNADQVAQSAREVATGERPGNVQILDLGVSDATTYLITNHTSAADLLDLVVASNPPYVEPFFTDTLGSEIFGQARSHEPETYDEDDEVEAGYINYTGDQSQPGGQYPATAPSPATSRSGHGASTHGSAAPQGLGQQAPSQQAPTAPVRKAPVVPPLPAARPAAGPAAGAAGAAAAGVAGSRGIRQGVPETTAPQPIQPDRGYEQDAVQDTVQHDNVEQALLQRDTSRSGNATRGAAGAAGADAGAAAASGDGHNSSKVSLWSENDYDYVPEDEYGDEGSNVDERDRRAGNFPAVARTGAAPAADYYDDEDDEPQKEPRSMRWLVGGLLAAVLVVGLIFAVTNLGSLFKSAPQTEATPGATAPPSAAQPSTGTPTKSTAPAAGPPAIEGITRQGNFDFAATYDDDLGKAFDGNAASYWSDMEFATEDWGGLAPEGVPLVVKLKSPSRVSSITLNQLGASGGSITVYTNDRPSLDGAKQVGANSFTSPDLTMPLAEPVTAQYVIISIKNLPKLAAPKTRFGYGLRLAEIKVQ
ncbi:ABC transporter substrate-binding protein [Arthrobacter sp. NPDC056691]|uniref:ABC transporter substrate-binding protein n=1 Tax=Arthrobacter sp. NPDC056691 TaxID=3345913 RepID=UPI003670F836